MGQQEEWLRRRSSKEVEVENGVFQAVRLNQFLGNWSKICRDLMLLQMVSGCRAEFLDDYEFGTCRMTNCFVKKVLS